VGPRAGLDRCGKSRPTGIPSPDRPARSQSLYRLRYPAHCHLKYQSYIDTSNLKFDPFPYVVKNVLTSCKGNVYNSPSVHSTRQAKVRINVIQTGVRVKTVNVQIQ
jgi:hypothetical protein